ncbi:uncharacterized protein LOC135845778 [Planococcus citri]|uniref:uncharacterized protein LOC135845778 n=1 Tax=Planococcus citri TaxID=170843 RepID=UPI0031F999F9
MLKKKSFSRSMASMRELFPLHDYKKKTQKNFIKENIQKVKGCKGCFLEKKMLKIGNLQDKHQESKPIKHSSSTNSIAPSIKCNVKIKQKTTQNGKNAPNENELNLINQSSQTEINREDFDNISVNCQSCGQLIDRRNVALQTSVDKDQTSDKKTNRTSNPKDPKDLPQNKKECPSKKSLDLSNYKMGVVPKYLKEKNARLELEQKEKAEQQKLAELRGLNDPKCPPGHMLMPPDELRNQIDTMEADFNALIKQLNMMPVSSDSYRVRQRKIQIEKALKELEEKLDLYKTGKVYVQMSD